MGEKQNKPNQQPGLPSKKINVRKGGGGREVKKWDVASCKEKKL